MEIQFWGAVGEVTGSCHLLQVGTQRILVDCGLIQGQPADEAFAKLIRKMRCSWKFVLRA